MQSTLVVRLALLSSAILLAHLGTVCGKPDPEKPPSDKEVEALINQLRAADFRMREEASAKLAKFGGQVLPALRKAASADKIDVEVKRRIELVTSRIEGDILADEEKAWKDLDAPARGIKDRLTKIQAKSLNDQQTALAVYLLCQGRAPSDRELAQACKQFEAIDGRQVNVLRLARSLVKDKAYNPDIAAANERLNKVRKEVAMEDNVAAKLAKLNGVEYQKVTNDVAASLQKAAKSEEQLVNLAFLLMLSRFPSDTQAKTSIDHLKRRDNPGAASDVIWALLNTKEFMTSP